MSVVDLPLQAIKQSDIFQNDLLLEILDLNGEQLTYYFEDKLIENPFIEFEYPIEHRVNQVPVDRHGHEADPAMDRQSPWLAQTLETFLYEQTMLYRHTVIRDVMVALIDYIDDQGYLPYTYEELAAKLHQDPIVVLDAITLLQQLEPAGVAAYNVKECLLLQTLQDKQAPTRAAYLLENFFDNLNHQDYAAIQATTGLSEEVIQECIHYYHSLRPVPASLFEARPVTGSIPDVKASIDQDQVKLEFNHQYYPRLKFNQTYYQEMTEQDDSDLQAYIQKHYQQYQSMEQALKLREQLVLAASQLIIDHQKDFFLKITSTPKPYLMKNLAEQMGLSEALVRLIVMNKNLMFNEVVYSLSDFINVSAKVGRSGLSALNIQALIKNIIHEQGSAITDQAVVELLAKDRIMISRHLVKRYRDSMHKDQP